MKKYFNSIKTSFKTVQPLLNQGNLKDHSCVLNRVLLLKKFLISLDQNLGEKPINVPNWRNNIYQEFLLPVLSEYFFLQEVLLFYQVNYGSTTSFQQNAMEHLKGAHQIVIYNMDIKSDYLLYQRKEISFSYLLDKYDTLIKGSPNEHFSHRFLHFPKAVLIIAIGNTLLKLHQYTNRITSTSEYTLALIQPAEWLGSKQEYAALIYHIKPLIASHIKRASRQELASRLAPFFNLIPPNVYRLFYNYTHRSNSSK